VTEINSNYLKFIVFLMISFANRNFSGNRE